MELSCQTEVFFNTTKIYFKFWRNILLQGELCCSEVWFFSKTANYRGPLVPIIHLADGLSTARNNVAGQIVSESFR